MACIIFPLIKASEISLGMCITPHPAPWPWPLSGRMTGELYWSARGWWWRGKIRERREKVQEAEGKTVGRSAGNYVGYVIG